MIKFPRNWEDVGQEPNYDKILNVLLDIIKELNCNRLALSGGVDSSLMLWCMRKVFNEDMVCYTIALNKGHPDYKYSKLITDTFGVKWEYILTNNKISDMQNDYPGDGGVRTFFNWLFLDKGVEEIICCDGIDEFMGGYYAHLHNPVHETYYDFMLKLRDEQLVPLDKNSGNVKVLLPYIDERLINLYNRIPMGKRFDSIDRKKVIKSLAFGKIPDSIINRRKYGFVDVGVVKNES